MKTTLFTLLLFLATIGRAQGPGYYSVLFAPGSSQLSEYEKNSLAKELEGQDLKKRKFTLKTPREEGEEGKLAKPRTESVKQFLVAKGCIADSVVVISTNENNLFWRDRTGIMERRVLITVEIPVGYYDLLTFNVVKTPQKACFDAATGGSVLGVNGTKLKFPPKCFMTASGEKVESGEVCIQLMEFLSIGDMIENGLATHSGSAMLETGGMIHITAWRGNEILYIAKDASYTATLPQRDNMKGMQVFTGERSGDGINWKQGGGTVRNTSTKLSKDGEGGDADGAGEYFMELKNMMWINCDRFTEFDNTSPLLVKLSGGENIRLLAVMTKTRAILPAYSNEFSKLPTNQEVVIIAYSAGKGNEYFAKTTIVPGKTKEVSLNVAKSSPSDLKEQLAQLNRQLP